MFLRRSRSLVLFFVRSTTQATWLRVDSGNSPVLGRLRLENHGKRQTKRSSALSSHVHTTKVRKTNLPTLAITLSKGGKIQGETLSPRSTDLWLQASPLHPPAPDSTLNIFTLTLSNKDIILLSSRVLAEIHEVGSGLVPSRTA